MNGFEIVGKIREKRQHKSTPVIAMTAADYPEIREEMEKSGMQGFLSKPFSPEDLRLILLKWLGKKS
jgi:CheY-like chemotaxis protein